MSYKVIDGVIYEVKEVNSEDILKSIKLAAEEINNFETSKKELEDEMLKSCEPVDNQIRNYSKQIESLSKNLIESQAKKESIVSPYKIKIDELNRQIVEVKTSLSDKKDIISTLLPEESKKLGL